MDADAVIRGLQHLRIRVHQRFLQGLALVLPFPRSALLITDRTLMRLDLPRPLLNDLNAAGMTWTVFDQVPENPSLTSVENGLQHFRK